MTETTVFNASAWRFDPETKEILQVHSRNGKPILSRLSENGRRTQTLASLGYPFVMFKDIDEIKDGELVSRLISCDRRAGYDTKWNAGSCGEYIATQLGIESK